MFRVSGFLLSKPRMAVVMMLLRQGSISGVRRCRASSQPNDYKSAVLGGSCPANYIYVRVSPTFGSLLLFHLFFPIKRRPQEIPAS